jgi:hypothetical protein
MRALLRWQALVCFLRVAPVHVLLIGCAVCPQEVCHILGGGGGWGASHTITDYRGSCDCFSCSDSEPRQSGNFDFENRKHASDLLHRAISDRNEGILRRVRAGAQSCAFEKTPYKVHLKYSKTYVKQVQELEPGFQPTSKNRTRPLAPKHQLSRLEHCAYCILMECTEKAIYVDLPGFQNAGADGDAIKEIARAALAPSRRTSVVLPIVAVDMSGNLPYYDVMFNHSIGVDLVARCVSDSSGSHFLLTSF